MAELRDNCKATNNRLSELLPNLQAGTHPTTILNWREELRITRNILAVTAALAVTLGVAGVAQAQAPIDAPETPATTIHHAPGNTPGFGGNSANPNGEGVNGGNGIHMISNGAPGQNGTPGNGDNDPPACDMHGGLNNYNDNCDE